LGHRGGGPDPVPGDVTDDHRDPAVVERHRVPPIPAELTARGRAVVAGDVDPVMGDGDLGDDRALQRLGDADLALAAAHLRRGRAGVERAGGLEVPLLPRLRGATDLLLPLLERLARTQAYV